MKSLQILLPRLFLIVAGISVLSINIYGMFTDPRLGVNYAWIRRAELIREIEGITSDGISRENLISLNNGDGMRFLFFLDQHLPKSATVIFPVDQLDRIKQKDILGRVNPVLMLIVLFPRKIEFESYFFDSMGSNGICSNLKESKESEGIVNATRKYQHSSIQFNFVFNHNIVASTDQYRFFLDKHPFTGSPDYHTEIVFTLCPVVK